uniref:Uncharacterized protein n=1 Tax=Candidatus Kentrum sp. DK TaxID=2126562 RepID=A0A450SGC0_9GAMM|nr:MAG: hypothetical protein BECKDK2373B_GA0170837_103528 [Candidatus Kentron sp. DK]
MVKEAWKVRMKWLNIAQQKNINRFKKKIPANAKDNIRFYDLPNGGIAMQASSLGNVLGSKAVYEKQIDVVGKTVRYTKTTYDTKGSIIHVKDKMSGETMFIDRGSK